MGETAGGCAWQVSETDCELRGENSVEKPRLAHSSYNRQEPGRVQEFLDLSSIWRTLSFI